jgi:hypothetical protein
MQHLRRNRSVHKTDSSVRSVRTHRNHLAVVSPGVIRDKLRGRRIPQTNAVQSLPDPAFAAPQRELARPALSKSASSLRGMGTFSVATTN